MKNNRLAMLLASCIVLPVAAQAAVSDDNNFFVSFEGARLYQGSVLPPYAYNTATTSNNVDVVKSQYPSDLASFSFGMQFGYMLPNTQNDIVAAYTGAHVSKGFYAANTQQNFSVDPVPLSGTNTFDYENINLTIGQHLKPSNNFAMRIGYGLEYVNIKQTMNGNGVYDQYPYSPVNPLSFATSDSAQFIGFGPKISTTADYFVLPNVALTGDVAVSMLLGKSKLNSVDSATDNFGSGGNEANQSNTRFVPGFGTGLGVKYVQNITNQINMMVGAGYKMQGYIGAFANNNMVNMGGSNNYYNYGPYLNLAFKF